MGRKRATDTPLASPNPPQTRPSRMSLEKALRHPKQHKTASGFWGSTRTSGVLQEFRTPLLTTFFHGSSALGQRGPGHTGDTYLPRNKKVFSPLFCHTAVIGMHRWYRRLFHNLLENKTKTSSYQPAKEGSFLIIIY